MADQTTFDELIAYYVNLLIIQYRYQPKAQATITLMAYMMMAAGIYFDVQNGYNIDPDLGDTAVGNQLDVIGKYVGVDRYFTGLDLINYFGMVTYSQHAALPASPPVFGLSTYATFGDLSYNGTLLYNDIITVQNALSDADFLTLIQFMILCNNMNYSAGEIDAALWEIFGSKMRAETNGNMAMAYFISGPVTTLINTIIFKGLLPAPMGVLINIVININDLLFAMVNYAQADQGLYSPYGYGFSTYSNYASLSGQDLVYSQITQE